MTHFSHRPLASSRADPSASRPPSTGCQPSTRALSPWRNVIHLSSSGSPGPHRISYASHVSSAPPYEIDTPFGKCGAALLVVSWRTCPATWPGTHFSRMETSLVPRSSGIQDLPIFFPADRQRVVRE